MVTEVLRCFATVEWIEVLDLIIHLKDAVARVVPNTLDHLIADASVRLIRIDRCALSPKELLQMCLLLRRPTHALDQQNKAHNKKKDRHGAALSLAVWLKTMANKRAVDENGWLCTQLKHGKFRVRIGMNFL